jgi:hypothetical protein
VTGSAADGAGQIKITVNGEPVAITSSGEFRNGVRKSSDVVLCSTGPTVWTSEYGCFLPSGWGIGLEYVGFGEYKWRAAMSTLKPMMQCCGMFYAVTTCSTSGLDGPGQDQSCVNGQPDISTALYIFHFDDNLKKTKLIIFYRGTRALILYLPISCAGETLFRSVMYDSRSSDQSANVATHGCTNQFSDQFEDKATNQSSESPPTSLPTRRSRHSHMYRRIPRCRHRPVPRLVGAMSS